MHVKQISAIVNSVTRQMWGADAPTVTNLSDIISLGDKVLNSSIDKDMFLDVLVDRIKRTIFRTIDVKIEMPSILMSIDSFYGVLQKINIRPMATQDNNSWNIVNENYQTEIWNIDKPNVSQSLFSNVSTFTIPMTVPDIMYESAFRDGQMQTFIEALFENIEKNLIMYINTLTHLLLCNLIAERAKQGKVVYVLDMFNAIMPTDKQVSANLSIYSPDFLKYSAMIVRNYISYVSKPSYLYNDGTELRATAKENLHVVMLSDYVSAYATYLESDTFNKELISLPNFTEVSYWQNGGNINPNFTDNSKVNIIPSSETGDNPTEYNVDNVFCVIADRNAIGLSLIDDGSGVDRNNRERYSNFTYWVNRGLISDLSENAVVFALSDNTGN